MDSVLKQKRQTAFTPNNMARIFDTSTPNTQDLDLQSPNIKCGGTGVGSGGEPGMVGENCSPQGNVLIIQESDTDAPDNNKEGGAISFGFYTPISDPILIGLMDIEQDRVGDVYFEIYRTGESLSICQNVMSLGDNSVQEEIIAFSNVEQVTLIMSGSGAIRYLIFCPGAPARLPPPCSTQAPSAPPHHQYWSPTTVVSPRQVQLG